MLYNAREPQGSYAECFRTIKTNLKYLSVDQKNKVILITSSEKGEGKSTIACNLAFTLAEDNKKVLVMDCDLRRPTVNKIFGISKLNGLTNILIGEKSFKDVIYKYSKNIDVLSSGSMPPNPAELLATEKLEKLLKQYKNEYDYVIVDSTPLGVVADSHILSSKVDGVILVVRAEQAKRKKLIECKDLIDKSGSKLIGAIVNRSKDDIKDYYYK